MGAAAAVELIAGGIGEDFEYSVERGMGGESQKLTGEVRHECIRRSGREWEIYCESRRRTIDRQEKAGLARRERSVTDHRRKVLYPNLSVTCDSEDWARSSPNLARRFGAGYSLFDLRAGDG